MMKRKLSTEWPTRRGRKRSKTTTPRQTSTTKGRSRGGNHEWSRGDIAFLRKYYRNWPTTWVANKLERTVYGVRFKASELNIKKALPSVWKKNLGKK